MSNYRLKYRALEPDDLAQIYLWENDLDLNRVSLSKVPLSKYILEQYISQAHLDIQEAGQFRFILMDEENNVVGCVDLFDYDAVARRAGIGIVIDQESRSKGYATEAITLMKDYAFNHIGMHQLHCSIMVDNLLSVKLFEKSGFKRVGIRKDWFFRNGSFTDVIEMQCINS
ncbi:MAG: GNAT family protein [Flavobacteriales bacterium]|nr:GNAT family protein [Flavobacteriales bacterium]